MLEQKKIKYQRCENPRILAHLQIYSCIKEKIPLYKIYLLKLLELWYHRVGSDIKGDMDQPPQGLKAQITQHHCQPSEIETDSQTQRTDLGLPRGKENGDGKDWEFGISRCKLLHIEWVSNKVLLYSKRNYIQYPMINHNGKEYMYNNHFASWGFPAGVSR